MIPKQLHTLGTGAALILGGLITLNLASSATIRAIRFTNEAKRVKFKSQTLFGSITFLFPLLGVRFSFCGFGAEKGGAALCALQRERVCYVQTVQRKCHHILVAFVRPSCHQPLPVPYLRWKQVAPCFFFYSFSNFSIFLELILGAWSTTRLCSVWLPGKQVPFCSFI
jgi:hypothetical protein